MDKYHLWYRNAVKCFRDLFKEIEYDVREGWKELGDERHITGGLITLIKRQEFQNKLNNCLKEKEVRIEIVWQRDPQEQFTGADIGAIIHIDLPDRCEEKGILLQAKRFDEVNGVFPNIKKKQAQAMIYQTAASFYIFYHPGGFWITSASNIDSICPPGQESIALSWPRLKAIPLLRFSTFMIEYFMKTFVGDARRQVVTGIRTGRLARWGVEFIVQSGGTNTRVWPT